MGREARCNPRVQQARDGLLEPKPRKPIYVCSGPELLELQILFLKRMRLRAYIRKYGLRKGSRMVQPITYKHPTVSGLSASPHMSTSEPPPQLET